MNKKVLRVSVFALLAGLFSLAGCESLHRIKSTHPEELGKAPVQAVKIKVAANKTAAPLFIIERNKNANIVRYDANLAPDGNLAPAEPVVAYWLLLAGDGSRKKLNWLEKKKAYGIRVKPGPGKDAFTLTLAAAPWLPLTVKKTGDSARAETSINGRPAVLEKMFIQARDRLIGPKVEYVELYGNDLQTGEPCREKIIPK